LPAGSNFDPHVAVAILCIAAATMAAAIAYALINADPHRPKEPPPPDDTPYFPGL